MLLAFLRSEFVDRSCWLTEKQLLDAVAVGQGAILATAGILLPGSVLVALSGPLLPKIRRSPLANAIWDGVVVGSLALMAVVAWQLARASVTSWFTPAIFVASAVAVMRFRVNQAWVVAGAAVLGWLVRV